METQEVRHYQVEQKYRVVVERAASTKGVLGYKIEANGDNLAMVLADIITIKNEVETIAPVPVTDKKE